MSLNEPAVGMEEAETASTSMGPPKTVRASKNQRKGHRNPKAGTATEKRIEAERAALVKKRQSDLEVVHDRHDTLVRELFHMENFVTLVGFNPEEAKQDNTAVFREYKSKYDLLEKTIDSSRTRRTRSAHTESIESTSAAIFSGVKPKKSVTRKLSISATPSRKQNGDNEGIWDILASAKGKGKSKEIEPESISVVLKKKRGDKIKLDNATPIPDDPLPFADETSTHVIHKRILQETFNDSPRKRRKTEEGGDISSNRRQRRANKTTFEESVSAHAMPTRAGSTRQTRNIQLEITSAPPALPPPPFISTIKRIKLVVRPPPPPLTNPRQRPPLSKHNASVSNFLSSYITLDNQDVDSHTITEMATHDARILDRIEVLRKKGRLTDPTLESTDLVVSDGPQRSGADVWDHIIEAVVKRRKVSSRSNNNGRQVASQVAKVVQGYWDAYAAKKEKARTQEERRLRMLAKATIKMVTGEWRKVVFHIREQERLKAEAEELQRGREHLDALLDQSGHILGAQKGDLTRRTRSRSSSASLMRQYWDDDGDEEEQQEEDDEQEKDDNDDEDEADVNDDEDSEKNFERGVSIQNDLEDIENARVSRESTPATLAVDFSEPVGPPSEYDGNSVDDTHSDGLSAAGLDQLMDADLPTHSPSRSPRSSSPFDSGLIEKHDFKDLDLSLLSPSYEERGSPIMDFLEPPSTHLRGHHRKVVVAGEFFDENSLVEERLDLHIVSSKHPDLSFGDINDLAHDLIPPDPVSPVERSSAAPEDESNLPESKVHQGHLSVCLQDPDPPTPIPPYSEVDRADSSTSSPAIISLPNSPTAIEEHTPHTNIDADDEPANESDDDESVDEETETYHIPAYLQPYAVAPVEWDPNTKVTPPLLLRGVLRPYQQSGLEWLASLHVNNVNGILADEMGLGKTIQTIALLAHLACDRGIWGPHLIVVPTSVLLNWEMEFKKFLPGFKILSYHGSTKRRKELRQGWNDKYHFNVCITSYTLASRDAHIFKRKAWYYMILDEAHMIKNFKSQRWNILLMFRSHRRLLLTGTPLQNNLTELWALLQFILSGTDAAFATLKEFGEWFSNPLEKAIEMGTVLDDQTMQRVSKLHTVLRPYLLRRLKRDVEKELPSKYEHLVLCPLSKRQRFLYDEFMSRAQTRDALQSGVYQKIANILMQLRKVCNHPDLFEVRPIVTSFAMPRSAIADFEIKEFLIRRQALFEDEEQINLDVLGLRFVSRQNTSIVNALSSRKLEATSSLPHIYETPGEPPPKDYRTIAGFRKWSAYQRRAETIARWAHIGYLNRLRCNMRPIYSQEVITLVRRCSTPLFPLSALDTRMHYLDTCDIASRCIKSYAARAEEMGSTIDRFAFVTPAVVALDMPHITLSGREGSIAALKPGFDGVLHRASVKLQIAFPDPSLLQYDCGKLQQLTRLLREKKAGGHRVLIFTQMTRILDILEIFLSFHGYLYLRLDGATKIEDRQYITERFNADPRVFCFIASSRSGGVGINLTGADTVVFYDSDFNPQMDRQCEDRAHRIGQIRDVHIYRFVSQHTVEEAMLRKANQKRSLDDLVIQKGEFDWRSLFGDETALTKALGEFEDTEDAHAAAVAAREEIVMEGADEADFGGGDVDSDVKHHGGDGLEAPKDKDDTPVLEQEDEGNENDGGPQGEEDEQEEGGTVADYMLSFALRDYEFFKEWRL